MPEQISANKRRALALVVAAAVVVVVVVWGVAALAGLPWLGLVLALVLAAVLAGVAYWRSDVVALGLSKAVPADLDRYARLHNVVEGLCAAAGLPKPALYVVNDDAPDALAIGRSPRHAAVVCTTGLIDKLTRMELEGVVAHELSHVKNYDILPATLAVTLVALPASLVPPLRAAALRRAVGTRREAMGDVNGVALTRYPPGLISALEKLRHDHGTATLSHGSKAIDHLWLDSSMEDVDERIAALREL